ncbi:CLUMA_CG014589, isoform A [Clunio marinus]|uniref:CLUMA_CG014589, isoform A n=1 Tax=Clunio marinus TaxID=568069 RepID=A0A1J1IPY8_9DIPT|nr:CLUMA_CG014589, isoform A [Clunio marinus]
MLHGYVRQFNEVIYPEAFTIIEIQRIKMNFLCLLFIFTQLNFRNFSVKNHNYLKASSERSLVTHELFVIKKRDEIISCWKGLEIE